MLGHQTRYTRSHYVLIATEEGGTALPGIIYEYSHGSTLLLQGSVLKCWIIHTAVYTHTSRGLFQDVLRTRFQQQIHRGVEDFSRIKPPATRAFYCCSSTPPEPQNWDIDSASLRPPGVCASNFHRLIVLEPFAASSYKSTEK